MTPQVRVLVAIEMKEIEDAPIDQAKVTRVDRKVVVAEPGDAPIENAPHGVEEERFGP